MRARRRFPHPELLALIVVVVAAAAGCGRDSTVAPPAGSVWKKHKGNPVLQRGLAGSWDASAVATPCVLGFGPDSYKMLWYTGRSSTTSQIGLATSSDGVQWSKYAGNPVLEPGTTGSWEGLGVEAPSVLYDSTGYRMYYTGVGIGSRSIGLCTSTDGVHWNRAQVDPILRPEPAGTSWDDREIRRAWVVQDGGVYKMWYGAVGAGYMAVGHATSSGGIFWAKLVVPVLEPEVLEALSFAPFVLKTGDSYRIWYGALHETPSGGIFPGVIDYAQSQDGIDWTANRTVLSPGAFGSWDGQALKSACVLDEGDLMKMWYEGESAGGSGSIGLATYP